MNMQECEIQEEKRADKKYALKIISDTSRKALQTGTDMLSVIIHI